MRGVNCSVNHKAALFICWTIWCSAAPVIDGGRLKAYVLQKLQQELQPGPFVIMYFHTAVQRNDNSPGMRTLRDIYESLPTVMKQRLESVYILHPGLRSRLLIATLGRFFLSEGYETLATHNSNFLAICLLNIPHSKFSAIMDMSIVEELSYDL